MEPEVYIKTAKSVLTQKELEYIPLSGGYMSFVLSVRFLTDFFNMDKYFKTKYPNLDCFAQLDYARNYHHFDIKTSKGVSTLIQQRIKKI